MFQIDRRIITHFDFLLPILVTPIIIFSYYLISEANQALAAKQLIYFAVGFFAFLFFFLLPIRKLEWLIPAFYWIGIVLLASVFVFGVQKLGAQRWIEIPFVHFTIQPSEFFKPLFLLMICYLVKQNPPPPTGYGLKMFATISIHILIPFALILIEPDLGTALVLLIIGYGVLFLVGVDKKIWLVIALVVPITAIMSYNYILHDYQKKRIETFLDSTENCENCHQVRQSIIAIGSGGLTGKNKDEATQTKLKFLPISTSDFIFAYAVERQGFFGGLALLLAYALLILHLMTIFARHKKDYFTQIMAAGMALLLFVYTGVNIAMTVGFAPVVGIPLPFFSYGGSSFITFMIFFGIFENLMAFRFDPMHKSIKYSANRTK
ncbi:MAG: rod shape-determining protein RodA [Campylobacteraceae bacterium]|nr:rod shape-determining protein RodA [Campylobacteraceae bacterium]